VQLNFDTCCETGTAVVLIALVIGERPFAFLNSKIRDQLDAVG
jgi:hypothetical protein